MPERTLYKVYLYNREDNYLSPVFYEDRNVALNQVLPFVQDVPRILMTDSEDHSVFESKMGRIVFPETVLDDMLNTTVQVSLDESKLYHTVEMISKLHHLVLSLFRTSASDRQALQSEINQLDIYIQGFAAATYNNICHLGYCNPDVMLQELEMPSLKYIA